MAKEVDCWVDTGAYADCGPGVATKLGYAGVGPYRIPHVRVDALAIYTNLPPNGAYRGYGAMQSVWASERTMDVLAERLGMSPLELRRMNLLRDGDRFATGEVMHDVRFEECLQAAADAVGYEADPRGKGLCVLLKGMQTPSRAAVTVERTPVGYVVRSASCEMGQGVRRSIKLHGRRAARLRARPGRASGPGHRQLAVRHAHDVEPLDAHDGPRARRRGRGPAQQRRSTRVRRGPQRGRPRSRHRARGSPRRTGTRAPRAHGSASTRRPARSDVEHLHGVAYAGRVVNRPGAELQNEGSMIMGLGTALFEAIDFADGQVANANLSDYNVPALADLPARFTHELIEREGAEVHGLGETALPPVPAAIGNALQSLGLRVHELPDHGRARARRRRRPGGPMNVPVVLNGREATLECEPTRCCSRCCAPAG